MRSNFHYFPSIDVLRIGFAVLTAVAFDLNGNAILDLTVTTGATRTSLYVGYHCLKMLVDYPQQKLEHIIA